MTKEISMANTLGARTARACDSCVRRRARVYCAADDAFLCAPCDSTVHSANPLARRHHRVPISAPAESNSFPMISPSWNKRKPRTPRQKPNVLKHEPMHDQVPDLYESQNSEEDLSEENEQLLYQVPVFDPELADLYTPLTPLVEETKQTFNISGVKSPSVDGLAGFQISEMDLEEFAADMESLLGGPEFDGLGGLMDMEAEAGLEVCRIKVDNNDMVENTEKKRDKLMLSLDYEGVMAAWGCQNGSPWTDGKRPRLGPDNCWPDFKGINGVSSAIGPIYKSTLTSEGREARVSRYREKRRTRLFAKKIRYEVRKLNAEKRPRMKGRFIKRTTMAACQSVPTMKIPMQLQRPIVPGSLIKGHFSC